MDYFHSVGDDDDDDADEDDDDEDDDDDGDEETDKDHEVIELAALSSALASGITTWPS